MSIDWYDLKQVIAYAKRLDSEAHRQVVVKHPNRNNYNITHKERTDLYKPEWVVWQAD